MARQGADRGVMDPRWGKRRAAEVAQMSEASRTGRQAGRQQAGRQAGYYLRLALMPWLSAALNMARAHQAAPPLAAEKRR